MLFISFPIILSKLHLKSLPTISTVAVKPPSNLLAAVHFVMFSGTKTLKFTIPRPLDEIQSQAAGLKSDPCKSPHLAATAAAARFGRVCNEAIRDALLKFCQGAYPCLLIDNLFGVNDLPETPTAMEPLNSSEWWDGAYAALALIEAIQHRPVAYKCENDGHLFVNLTALPGSGRLAEKARLAMRGHTDACSFPFPSEVAHWPGLSPAPDVVVLIGYRNPDAVPTCVAPLSAILDKLDEETIEELFKAHFIIDSQDTFKTPHILTTAPILSFEPARGLSIRFSHSKIMADPDFPKAAKALAELQQSVSASFQDVVVAPGSVCLVNNRNAIHGRRLVGGEIGGHSRWLMRTYANLKDNLACNADPERPYLLFP
jgi:hypothetical protein